MEGMIIGGAFLIILSLGAFLYYYNEDRKNIDKASTNNSQQK